MVGSRYVSAGSKVRATGLGGWVGCETGCVCACWGRGEGVVKEHIVTAAAKAGLLRPTETFTE